MHARPGCTGEITSQAGWSAGPEAAALPAVIRYAEIERHSGEPVCRARADAVQLASSLGADRVELYTEPFARAFERGADQAAAPSRAYAEAARLARSLGLGVNAGHDLDLENLIMFRELPHLDEVSIGHAIVSRALFAGLRTGRSRVTWRSSGAARGLTYERVANRWASPRAWTLASAVASAAIIVLTPVVQLQAASAAHRQHANRGRRVAIAGTFYDSGPRAGARRHPATHVDEIARGLGRRSSRLADAGLRALAIDFRGHGGSSAVPPSVAGGDPDLTRLVLDVPGCADVSRRAKRSRCCIGDWHRRRVAGRQCRHSGSAADPAVRSLASAVARVSTTDRSEQMRPIRKYGGRPALLLAGSNDPYALRSAKELAAGGGGIREIRILENAGHGTTMLKGDHDLGGVLVDWFQRALL